MKIIIGIASVKNNTEHREELPVAKIYVTESGEYLFLERTVIDRAIARSLKNLEIGKHAIVPVSIEIVPIAQRVKRGKR